MTNERAVADHLRTTAWQSPETAPCGEWIYLRDRDGRNISFGYFDEDQRWFGQPLPNAFEWKR